MDIREPQIIANTLEELAPLLERHDLVKTPVRSAYIIALIDEVAAKGFPYNSAVESLFKERTGLSGPGLGMLVFQNQNYRDQDKRAALGYAPFTPEMLQKAFETGKKIEFYSESILTGEAAKVLAYPKEKGGKVYAFAERSRTKYYSPQGQPAKIVS